MKCQTFIRHKQLEEMIQAYKKIPPTNTQNTGQQKEEIAGIDIVPHLTIILPSWKKYVHIL